MTEPTKCTEGCRLHSKECNFQIFTNASNIGLHAQVKRDSVKGLYLYLEEELHINVLEMKAVLALKQVKSQYQNQIVLGAMGNPVVVA